MYEIIKEKDSNPIIDTEEARYVFSSPATDEEMFMIVDYMEKAKEEHEPFTMKGYEVNGLTFEAGHKDEGTHMYFIRIFGE